MTATTETLEQNGLTEELTERLESFSEWAINKLKSSGRIAENMDRPIKGVYGDYTVNELIQSIHVRDDRGMFYLYLLLRANNTTPTEKSWPGDKDGRLLKVLRLNKPR